MTPVEGNHLASVGLVVLIWLDQVVAYPASTGMTPDRFVR